MSVNMGTYVKLECCECTVKYATSGGRYCIMHAEFKGTCWYDCIKQAQAQGWTIMGFNAFCRTHNPKGFQG